MSVVLTTSALFIRRKQIPDLAHPPAMQSITAKISIIGLCTFLALLIPIAYRCGELDPSVNATYTSSAILVPGQMLSVHCNWVQPDPLATHDIRSRPRPDFPLIQAWLKPESARYGSAPKTIPPSMKDSFTMNNTIFLDELYYDNAHLGGSALVSDWSVQLINEFRTKIRARFPFFAYDSKPIYQALDAYAALVVKGKRGLVIGTENPWLEAFLIEYGASHVTTLEFGSIHSHHPQITTFTPKDFTLSFLQGRVRPFDFAFTYSSIEHDGLGRYGDVLNAFGDLETMARMLSVVKPGGFIFVGVPCCYDALYWNAHRVYGVKRFTELFAGWRVLGVLPVNAMQPRQTWRRKQYTQPVWVLQNTFGCSNGETVLNFAGLLKEF